MEQILSFLERELRLLRDGGPDMARRYPAAAGALAGGTDPHVDMLAQAVSSLHARVAHLHEAGEHVLDEALLDLLWPGYLAPFPPCAIAKLSDDRPATACGALLPCRDAGGARHPVRAAFAVPAAGARLLEAELRKDCVLSFAFQVPAPAQGTLRLFVDGDASFCSALREALFLSTTRARVWRGTSACGGPVPLPRSPVEPAGFAAVDAITPAQAGAAVGILREYFAFPEKFEFIDVDLEALGSGQVRLEIEVDGLHQESPLAVALAGLCPERLQARCTPVASLFPHAAEPVAIDQRSSRYGLRPQGGQCDVFSVDQVRVRGRPCQPLHGKGTQAGAGWIVRRDESMPDGHQLSIAFGRAQESVHSDVASIDLTCCERSLPPSLEVGEGGRLLRTPTPLRRLAVGKGLRWRLAILLSQGQRAPDAASLRELLTAHDLADSPATRRQIASIAGLDASPAVAWKRTCHGIAPVQGILLKLQLDPAAFAGASLPLFAQVLRHYFAGNAHLNTFVQLAVLHAATGEELFRCHTT